ncbi:MAG TPA: RNA polymerase sigma factor [Longimicrobium sp.]
MSIRIPFADALHPHYEDALRYSRALCARSNSAADAEDVLQDAFLNALRKYDSLKDHEKFRAWLFTIITRSFHNHVRRSFWKRFIPMSAPEAERTLPTLYNRDPSVEDRLLIDGALARLNSGDRTAILLYEVGGFSVREIASMCGDRSLSAVKSRLARARQRLRTVLSDHKGGDDISQGLPSRGAATVQRETNAGINSYTEIDYAHSA